MPQSDHDTLPLHALFRRALRLIFIAAMLVAAGQGAAAQSPAQPPLRVAVYDLAPYGELNPDGSFSGASVDLWRRVAETAGYQYTLIAVPQMEAIMTGLQEGRYDVAIGAITITPERSARHDFSFPAHRSGVAVALRRGSTLQTAVIAYGVAALELSSLIVTMLGLLVLIGVAMWYIERPTRLAGEPEDSLGRDLARRHLLGGRDDDDRRLWRQDAEDPFGPAGRNPVDAGSVAWFRCSRRASFRV